MTALLGVFSDDNANPSGIATMLARLRRQAGPVIESWSGPGAYLVALRHEWEVDPEFSGGRSIALDQDLVAVSDASLYYRDDLARALRIPAAEAEAHSASELILSAYRAWGPSLVDRLEGDFAFLIWDSIQRWVVCGRDFTGSRPLYYGTVATDLVVTSGAAAIPEHPQWKGSLNLRVVAEAASGLFGSTEETAFAGVESVPAGAVLAGARTLSVAYRWTRPEATGEDTRAEAGAADELRALIRASVATRASRSRTTAIWLSGGWDSTAIFAVAESSRAEAGSPRLQPISMSYPPGDPGREDELIERVAERWSRTVDWVDIDSVDFFASAAEYAAGRDDISMHLFEAWNRTLAKRSVARGCRITLIGKGGDDLFAVSDVFLADLLRRGRLRALAAEWQARGRPAPGSFLRRSLRPLLPFPLRQAYAALRGRSAPALLQRGIAPWIRREFVRSSGLQDRQRFRPATTGATYAAREFAWFLAHPYFARLQSQVVGFGRDVGTEVRSPLFDQRIVQFAARRPVSDRAAGGETKRLLRRAMKGLLPDEVLAPRAKRTGVTSGFLVREVQRRGMESFQEAFDNPILAQLRIVDEDALQSACREMQNGGSANLAANLVFTYNTELWLRARLEPLTRFSAPTVAAAI